MRKHGMSLTFAALAVVLLTPPLGITPADAQGTGSAELELLGPKTTWSAIDRKIDPNLLLAARAFSTKTNGGRPTGTSSGIQAFIEANVAADQSIFIVIKGTVSSDLLALLNAIGAYDISPFPQYGTVTARVPVKN